MTTRNPADSGVTEELEPCPFCGVIPAMQSHTQEDEMDNGRYLFFVECGNSQCPMGLVSTGGPYKSAGKAAERWNTRVRASVAAPPGDALLSDEDAALLAHAITIAREVQEFIWADCYPSLRPYDAEGWRRLFQKRVDCITDIDLTKHGGLAALRKRLLQQAALSIKALALINRWAKANPPRLSAGSDGTDLRQATATPSPMTPSTTQAGEVSAAPVVGDQDEAPVRREVRSSRHPHFTAADHQRMKETLDSLSDYPTEAEAEAALRACGTSGKEVVNEFIERLLRENLELKTKLTAAAPLAAPVGKQPQHDWRWWDTYLRSTGYTDLANRMLAEFRPDLKWSEFCDPAPPPASPIDAARRAAEEIRDWLGLMGGVDGEAINEVAAIISKHFAATEPVGQAPEAMKRASKLCRSVIPGARVELIFQNLQDAQAVHKWLIMLSATPADNDAEGGGR